MVNLVKPNRTENRSFLQNRTENRTEVIFCWPHTPIIKAQHGSLGSKSAIFTTKPRHINKLNQVENHNATNMQRCSPI